jgi:hypothetical protein
MDRFPTAIGSDGSYVVSTGKKITGPPIGTATFDSRDTNNIPHCTG